MDPRPEPVRRLGPDFVDDPLVIFRRAALWTLLCSISAAPSFFVASGEYSRPAMMTGVAIFIVFYTAAASTGAFHRFSRRPFVRKTLYAGYIVRVAISLILPLGVIVDFFPGMVSVSITEHFYGNDRSFVPTLITTLFQGTFVNIILGIFMLVVYGLQRAFLKPPPPNDGTCERCGYDLRASYQFGRCPECGTPCSVPAAGAPCQQALPPSSETQ